MIVRARLDLSWRDFAFAAGACLLPQGVPGLERGIGEALSAPGKTFVGLSLRSGLDALLQALALPAGSEVLMSAVTIFDMGEVVRANHLVPVPVDIDPDTLEPSPEALRCALSPRTKALLVAHLFGARIRLEESKRFARENGLLFLEDLAQSYLPGAYRGDPESDVRMLSFGPIKTDTALGGGALILRDPALLEAMKEVQETQPRQRRRDYGKRVVKYGLLQLLGLPPLFGLFRSWCSLTGQTHDEVIGRAARGFGGGVLMEKIRQRPSGPQLAMLRRRLEKPGIPGLARRAEVGRSFAEGLPPGIRWPGKGAPQRTHWTFPILVPHPEALMRHLWSRGFDATRGTNSLGIIGPAPERPEMRTPMARELVDQILFIPVYPGVSTRRLEALRMALEEYGEVSPS